MLTLLATVLVLGGLIFVHELGHFLAAKRAGVYVHEFALGFGPRLFSVRRDETTYALRLLPFGGFVRMAGMHPQEEDAESVPEARRFASKPVGSRMGIVLAGPAANFLLAVVLFAVLYTFIGVPTLTLTVADVEPGFPATGAGIRPGDRIVAVDGEPVGSWEELVGIVRASAGRELELVVERGGRERTLSVVPSVHEEGYGVIGIRPVVEQRRYGVGRAVVEGFAWTGRVVVAFVGAVAGLLRRQAAGEILGPVGIGAEIGEATRSGLSNVIFLAALLSAHLGLINLVPIPALDGSRMVFLAVEGLRGRPVDPDKENLIHLIGFALMIALLVLVSVRDVARLVG